MAWRVRSTTQRRGACQSYLGAASTAPPAELDERLGRLMGERRERLKEDAQSLMRRRRRRMQLTVLRENLFDSSW